MHEDDHKFIQDAQIIPSDKTQASYLIKGKQCWMRNHKKIYFPYDLIQVTSNTCHNFSL